MPAVAEVDPFADLVPKDIIGGDNGGLAYQVVAGNFSEVPRAEVNTPTALGAFADLVPADAQPQEYGQFSDLVPQSPTSETEKALAETPKPDDPFIELEKGVSNLSGIPIHEAMNTVRVFGSAAGRYIFNGLQGLELNRAKLLAHPTPEMVQPQGDEIILPDGSAMSKEQEAALERHYIKEAQSGVPEALARAEYFKQRAEGYDKFSGVDPDLAETIPARLAGAAGSAAIMGMEALIPGAGIPLMVMHGAAATEAEARNQGKTPEEAEAAAVRSAIGLALFGGASKLAALGVARLLSTDAEKLTKFIAQFTGQAGANDASSRAIGAWEAAAEAPESQKVEAAMEALKDTTLETTALNTVYALMHASKAAGAPVRPATASERTQASRVEPESSRQPLQSERAPESYPPYRVESDAGRQPAGLAAKVSPMPRVLEAEASRLQEQPIQSQGLRSQPEIIEPPPRPAESESARHAAAEPLPRPSDPALRSEPDTLSRQNAFEDQSTRALQVPPKEGQVASQPELNPTSTKNATTGFIPAEDIFGFGPGAAAAGELPPWRKTATAMQEQINSLVARQRAERTPEKQTRDQLRTADKWLEADRNEIRTKLLDFSKNLPLAERAKFLPAITSAMRRAPILSSDPAVMYRRAEAVLNRMTEKVYDVNKKAVAGEIERILTRTQDSKSMTVAEKEAIRERGNTFNQLKDKMSLDMLENMRARMLEIQKQGKELFALDQTMQAERTKSAIREITTQGTRKIDSPENVRMALGETERAWTRRINQMKRWPEFIKHFNLSLTPMDWLIQTFDRAPQGAIYRTLKVPVDVKYGEWLDASSSYKKRLSDVVKKHGMTEGSLDRVYAAAEMRQEGGLENLKALGYTEKELKALRLTRPELEYLREADAINSELFPVLKDVLNKSFHQEIEQVPGYFPRQRDWDYYNTLSIEEGKFARSMNRTNTEKGFTVSRVGATTKNITNAHEVMMNHIDDALYHIKMGPEIRRVADVVKSKDFAGSVGTWGQKVFSDWVDVLSRNGGIGGGRRIHFIDFLRKNVGMAQLAFRLTTTALQPVSLIQGMAVVSPKNLARALDGFGSPIRRDFILKNFPEIRARVGDDPAYSDYGGSGLRDKLARTGFKAIGALDRMAAMAIGEAAYRDSLGKRGIKFDLNRVDPQAVQDAQLAVRKTQSSAFPKDVSLAQSRGNLTTNASVDQAILQFQNFIINKWALLKNGALQMGIKEKSPVAAARIMTFLALGTIAEVLARDGIKRAIQATVGSTPQQDKENRKADAQSYTRQVTEKAAVDLVTGMPVISNISGMLRYDSSGVPLADTGMDVVQGIGQIFSGKKTETKMVGAIRAGQAAGALMGVPTGQAGDLAVQAVRSNTPKKKTASLSPTMAF